MLLYRLFMQQTAGAGLVEMWTLVLGVTVTSQHSLINTQLLPNTPWRHSPAPAEQSPATMLLLQPELDKTLEVTNQSEIIRMWCWDDISDVACKYLQDQDLRQNPATISINFMSNLWRMMDKPNHLFPTLLLTVNSRIRNNWQNQLLLFYGEIFCTKWAELRSQSQFMEMRWKNHQKFVHVFIVMSITNWLLD